MFTTASPPRRVRRAGHRRRGGSRARQLDEIAVAHFMVILDASVITVALA